MKWKHKQTGWIAQTTYYDVKVTKHASFSYEAGGLKQTVSLPTEIIQADENWEEIPDGRWLDKEFTVKEFMEAFAMVITEGANNHDSLVAKGMVDRKIKERHEKE